MRPVVRSELERQAVLLEARILALKRERGAIRTRWTAAYAAVERGGPDAVVGAEVCRACQTQDEALGGELRVVLAARRRVRTRQREERLEEEKRARREAGAGEEVST